MDTSHLDEESCDVIQLKTCPLCKRGIRKSLRYGNIIKQQLLDIEKVKAKVNGKPVEIEVAKKDLETSLRALKPTLESEDEERDWDILMKRVTKLSNTGHCHQKPGDADEEICRDKPEAEAWTIYEDPEPNERRKSCGRYVRKFFFSFSACE